MSEVYYEGCAACDQRKWLNDPNTDLEAANPSAIKHTCPLESAPSKPEAAQEACEHEHEGKDDGLPCPLCWQLPEFSSPSPAATTQPEPKPAPQAEGSRPELDLSRLEEDKKAADEWWLQVKPENRERAAKTAYAIKLNFSHQLAAQAPLLAKIAELGKVIKQLVIQKETHKERAEVAEARLAELESAQPKAEPVEKLVSDDELVRLVYEFNLQDSRQLIYESEKDGIDIEVPTHNYRLLADYLLMYRQREERRGE